MYGVWTHAYTHDPYASYVCRSMCMSMSGKLASVETDLKTALAELELVQMQLREEASKSEAKAAAYAYV